MEELFNDNAFVLGQTVLHKSPSGMKAERIYLGTIPGAKFPYMLCTKEVWERIKNGDEKSKVVIFSDNIEKVVHKVKLTRQDISEGKGVGVDPSLIELVD